MSIHKCPYCHNTNDCGENCGLGESISCNKCYDEGKIENSTVNLINKAKAIQDWIVESEMGLPSIRNSDDEHNELDKTDTFYPAYKQLDYTIEKLTEEI